MTEVAIVGGGLSGMAVALLLQARGVSTMLFEAHSRLGGCAGFYARSGFSFDIGATTLVDFHEEGLGGRWLQDVGLPPLAGEFLPGYLAWLPDRTVEVARDPLTWARERLACLGSTDRHVAFWRLLDDLADAFWPATRRGLRMPLRCAADLWQNWRALKARDLPLLRYLGWTMGDALDRHGLGQDTALKGLLSMMIEDTVHAQLGTAPLINAALGISIRGAGLARPVGGMRGFWRSLAARYVELGGRLKLMTPVEHIEGRLGAFSVRAGMQSYPAAQVVCALPFQAAQRIAPGCVGPGLERYITRDAKAQGGGLVLCLGVPEAELLPAHRGHRHHQLLQDYGSPLGNGNNMFISASAAEDTLSAPAGWRAVMVSTHCELSDWEAAEDAGYQHAKAAATQRLLSFARRVYPELGGQARVMELGTPRSYERFTGRPRGAIGGARLSMTNSNQHAVPYDIGRRGFWLAGDTTWPGLGTVACVLGARHVADGVHALARRQTACQPRTARRLPIGPR